MPRPSTFRLTLAAATLIGGAASGGPSGTGESLEAGATAAIAARQGESSHFQNLSAFIQSPGRAHVCGEVTPGPMGEAGWHSFFALRTARGWSYSINRGVDTFADHEACVDMMRKNSQQMNGGSPIPRGSLEEESAEIDRRCPMESETFWGNQQMVCAGHPDR